MEQPKNSNDQHLARLRLISNVWNWLPAFRAVAETNHLPTAAARLHVSPSALSRTIKLLEDALETELFDRIGRGIELNQKGRLLLDATRDATRRVHSGIEAVLASSEKGPVTLACGGVFSLVYLAPTLHLLSERHPELQPTVVPVRASTLVADLSQGALDIGVLSVEVRDSNVETRLIAQVENGVFCGPSHPLYERNDVGEDELLLHEFVAPPPVGGRPVEGWPPERERTVRWRVSRMQEGVSMTQTGIALAVLPVPVGEGAGLWQLPFDGLEPVPVFAVTRKSLGVPDRAELAFTACEQALNRPTS